MNGGEDEGDKTGNTINPPKKLEVLCQDTIKSTLDNIELYKFSRKTLNLVTKSFKIITLTITCHISDTVYRKWAIAFWNVATSPARYLVFNSL